MTKMLKVVGASWLQTKISSYVLGALGMLAIVALFLGELERIQDDGNYAATVFYSEKAGYRIQYWGQSNELASVPKGVARAYYRQDISTTGWAQLEIETDASYKDKIQAYAAGMLEGALTWKTIHSHLINTVESECENAEKDCDRIKDQLEHAANIDKKNAAKYEDDDPFWHQIGLFYAQIEGILIGWKYGVERSDPDCASCVEPADLYWLNAMSEIMEIKKHLNITSKDMIREHLPGLSSALLKVVDDGVKKKILVAHNTAAKYNTMIRILKRYHLNYHLTDADDSPLVPGTTIQFSGYPAAVSSHDDMYILTGKDLLMAITGTTINNYNKDLWKNVNIVDQVPIGPRVSAANRLSTNVISWVHTLAKNNSGTACKQWMVVNLKQLDNTIVTVNETGFQHQEPNSKQHKTEKTKKNFKDSDRVSFTIENNNIKHTIVHHGYSGKLKGLFWLVEQIPGHTHSGDLSNTLLRQGFWATYGLPFFKDITANTHLAEKEAEFGNIFSYSNSPRAQLFRNSSKNLTDMESIIKFMRGNNMTLLTNNTDTLVDSFSKEKAMEKTLAVENHKEIRCADGTLVGNHIDCLINEKAYWVNLAVRGDLAHQYQAAFGVIDTKVFSGNAEDIEDFAAISSPTYTETPHHEDNIMNKGNVAAVAINNSNNFNDESAVSKNAADSQTVPPFQWSQSKFSEESHIDQPDSFTFTTFKPHWVW